MKNTCGVDFNFCGGNNKTPRKSSLNTKKKESEELDDFAVENKIRSLFGDNYKVLTVEKLDSNVESKIIQQQERKLSETENDRSIISNISNVGHFGNAKNVNASNNDDLSKCDQNGCNIYKQQAPLLLVKEEEETISNEPEMASKQELNVSSKIRSRQDYNCKRCISSKIDVKSTQEVATPSRIISQKGLGELGGSSTSVALTDDTNDEKGKSETAPSFRLLATETTCTYLEIQLIKDADGCYSWSEQGNQCRCKDVATQRSTHNIQ